ncbi:MAG TPA: lipocalin family protein [Verrucomicrobium sp.]|nr:lipocalin family protein [Verrucomicrobium sp.]
MTPSPPSASAQDRLPRLLAVGVLLLTLLAAFALTSCSTKPMAPVQSPAPSTAKAAASSPSTANPTAALAADTNVPSTVPHVDLPRYMGEWHVIANVPYFLEKGKVDTSDIYKLRADGKIDNIFQFRKGSMDAPYQQWKARAWVVNEETNAEWKLQFIWPLTTTYLVVDLDPQYRWSVVTIPSKKLIWILSKDRKLPETTYEGILGRLKARGFAVEKIQKVPQGDASCRS